MKRFTETGKWRDPWFTGLGFEAKLVFFYVVDNCDAAGVWEPDYRLANFLLGRDVEWEVVIGEFGDRVKVIKGGKWWLTRFVGFQQKGKLNKANPAHRNVIKLMEYHGIMGDCGITVVDNEQFSRGDPSKALPRPCQGSSKGLPSPIGKGKGKGIWDDRGVGEEGVVKVVRARNEVMDALAEIAGIPLEEIGPAVAKRLQAVIRTIKQSTPEVTAAEVRRRAQNYCGHFNGAVLTPEALGKHWGVCHAKTEREGDKGSMGFAMDVPRRMGFATG